MHILSPETDNCPSWISGRERMTVENISWSISTKECYRPRRGLNLRPPGLQSDGVSNWATEAGNISIIQSRVDCKIEMSWLTQLSRHRLSRITAYLEMKIWSLFKHENLTTGNKILWKRGEIAGAISPLFHNIFNISNSAYYRKCRVMRLRFCEDSVFRQHCPSWYILLNAYPLFQ